MTTTTDNGGTTSQDNGKRHGASVKVRDAASGARTRASDAYSSARDRTSSAFSSGKETAARATRRTVERIDTNPVAAIAGGLALGAVLGAILPRTQREQQALGDVGHKINDAAREAANTAVETGRQQVNELSHNAMAKVGSAVVEAVTSGNQSNGQ